MVMDKVIDIVRWILFPFFDCIVEKSVAYRNLRNNWAAHRQSVFSQSRIIVMSTLFWPNVDRYTNEFLNIVVGQVLNSLLNQEHCSQSFPLLSHISRFFQYFSCVLLLRNRVATKTRYVCQMMLKMRPYRDWRIASDLTLLWIWRWDSLSI